MEASLKLPVMAGFLMSTRRVYLFTKEEMLPNQIVECKFELILNFFLFL